MGAEDLVITNATLATPAGVRERAWLSVRNGTIDAIATTDTTEPTGIERLDVGGALVIPGFIDMHCHGGGGGSFSSADATELRTGIDTHRDHGTTTMLASLVSDTIGALTDQIAALAEFVHDGELAGVHLEGPFIAESRRGAHDPTVLRAPESGLDPLLAAGADVVRMITLAPELPGGIKAVRTITEAGMIAAIGHTEARADQVQQAIDAGATVATHLFNGMRPLHHREPGPIGALLDDERVTVELICDLVHLHPRIVHLAASHAGRHRTVLVTDAMSATGAADGRYRLGEMKVDVRDGVATLPGSGSLAGSTLTMDTAFRNLVHTVGVDVSDAVYATSTRPAELLGIAATTGSLCPGRSADLLVLDADLRPTRVMRRGRWWLS